MSDEKKPTILGLKKDLEDFKTEVIEILKGFAPSPREDRGQVTETESDAGPQEQVALPANYQAIFEEYFDPNDGFTAEMSYEGNISFTIIVPMKYSNTTEAWRTLYKVDRRTKVLKQGGIESGIKDWCSKVAHNIHYDKTLIKK